MSIPTFDPDRIHSLRAIPHSAGLFSGVFDTCSQRYLAGTTDGQIVAWPYPDWSDPVAFRWNHRSYVYALGPLPKQGQVISAGFDRRLVWWDALEGVPLREVRTEGRPLNLSVSPDERFLAVVDDDRRLRLYDCATGQMIAEHDGHPAQTAKWHPSSVYCVAFSPDGRLIATGDRTGTVLVREVETGQVVHTLAAPQFYADYRRKADGTPADGEYELGGVRLVVFSPDGTTIVAGGMADYDYDSAGTDGKMGLVGFSIATGKESFAWKLPKDQGYLQTAQFHPSGLLIAAGGGGTGGATGMGAICVLDLSKPQDPIAHSCEMTIRSLSICPHGNQFVVCGMLKTAVAGRVEVWNLPPPTPSS